MTTSHKTRSMKPITEYNARIAEQRQRIISEIVHANPMLDESRLDAYGKEHGNVPLTELRDTLRAAAAITKQFSISRPAADEAAKYGSDLVCIGSVDEQGNWSK